MRRWWVAVGLAAVLTVTVAALIRLVGLVSQPWPAVAVDQAARRPHLILIAQEYGNPYWGQVRAGAESAAKGLGVTVQYVGPERWTVQAHSYLLGMAIASRPDGILTQGLSEADFTPLINKAMERGIPVITIDTDSPSRRLAYVGTDNYQSGLTGGRLLVEATGGQGEVGIITGSLSAANQVDRVRGIRDAIRAFPGIREVAIEESNIGLIGATEAAVRILQEHRTVKVLIGTSALDGPGAARAVAAMGLRGKVLVIGWDDVPETRALLQEGDIYATVVQNPYAMGVRGVELMVDHLNGRPIPGRVDTGVHVLRASGVAARKEGAS